MVFLRKTFSIAGRSAKSASLLTNKWVLYAVFLVAIGCLFFFAITKNLFSLLVFALVGFLTFFFHKNMIVVLFMAIAVTGIVHFLFFSKGHGNLASALFREGFDTDSATPDKKEAKDSKEPSSIKITDDDKGDDSDDGPDDDGKKDAPDTTPPVDNKSEIEKLKLQLKVLEELKNMEPFLSSIK